MSRQLYIDLTVVRKVLMVVLCLLLVVTVVARPMVVSAASSGLYYAISSLAASLFANGFRTLSDPDNFQSLWNSVANFVGDMGTSAYNEFYEVFGLVEIYSDINRRQYINFDEKIQKYLLHILTDMTSNVVAFRSSLDHSSVDLDTLDTVYFPSFGYGDATKDVLLKDGFVPLQLTTRIYIPSQELVESGSEITFEQLLTGQFESISAAQSVIIQYLYDLLSEAGIRMEEYAYSILGMTDVIDYRIDQLTTYVRTEVLYAIREGYVSLGRSLDKLSADLYKAIDDLTLYVRTEVLDNIRGASVNVINRLDQFETSITEKFDALSDKVSSLIDAVNNLDTVGTIQGVLSPGIATDAFEGVLAGVGTITDFFNPSGSGDDEDLKIPLWPYFDTSSSIWSFFADSEFISALTSFFNFVAALWVLFPLGIRYLIMFGFCFPFMFAGVKMLVG